MRYCRFAYAQYEWDRVGCYRPGVKLAGHADIPKTGAVGDDEGTCTKQQENEAIYRQRQPKGVGKRIGENLAIGHKRIFTGKDEDQAEQ